MSTLERKLARDIWRLKGQVATIALVLACGVMALIMLRSTYQSLLGSRDAYYEQYRFADVFARLERAPLALESRLAKLPGIAVACTRIAKEVLVPIEGESDPVTGRILSIPDDGVAALNDVYLRAGRMPAAEDEAVVLEQFAIAHQLAPGARLPVVINGRLRSLRITGIALSPEFVLAMSGRELAADNRRFVALWMVRSAVAPAFQMDGAFNDVAFRLEPGASLPAALEAIDRELAPYGGLHAIGRDKQMSNNALGSELSVLRTLGVMIPAIFLAVAAFLVNVVISRLVFLERTQIAVLKALGFRDRRIGLHYLALVALIVMVGAAAGIALGIWSGGWMTHLYETFYKFPTHMRQISPAMIALAVGIGLVAGVTGALAAVFRIARMPPAQAMRPPAPLSYRRTLVDRLRISRLIGPAGTIVIREIRRKPFRFAMSTFGIAMGISIFVMGRFSWDSFDYMMSVTFLRDHHEDITVTVTRAAPVRALAELESIPGVRHAEGHRVVPVRLHAGAIWRDAAMIGRPEHPVLGVVPSTVPPAGLILTDKLAELLAVRAGDLLDVEILEGDFSRRVLPVAGTVHESLGLQAYAREDWLAAVLHEQPRVSQILLEVDADRAGDVRARLKEMPAVLAVTSTESIIKRYREQMGGSMNVMVMILTLSAAAIAIGIVYNNARIALSLRSRDLATLRVLGFTRVEISTMLLGELAGQVLLGVPLGLWLGTAWSRLLAASIDPETIRFDVHISLRTYVAASVIALVSGLVSALLVRRKLDALDLVSVLKSSE